MVGLMKRKKRAVPVKIKYGIILKAALSLVFIRLQTDGVIAFYNTRSDRTSRQCSIRPSPTQRRTRLSANIENNGNLKSSGNIHKGTTLMTKQILYPEIYLSNSLQSSTSLNLEEDVVPLFVAIRSLIHSLQAIIQAADADEEGTLLQYLHNTTILRIEQPIAAVQATDPLCWLHAQKQIIQNIGHKLSTRNERETISKHRSEMNLPVIYFGDAERQVEAAVIGKASSSYSDSWDPFVGKRIWDDESECDDCVNGDDQNRFSEKDVIIGEKTPQQQQQAQNERPSMFKETDLPPRARVYGGSRFDWKFYKQRQMKNKNRKNNSAKDSTEIICDWDDWDRFGGDRGGYWILPAVELRREVVHVASPSEDNSFVKKENNEGVSVESQKRVTLAAHVHNLATSSRSDNRYRQQYNRRKGWHDAAQHTLNILQDLTDQLSPPIPCTTLPPILTRSEYTKTGAENGGGNGDPGYAFEKGVLEALRQIKVSDMAGARSSNSSHSEDPEKSTTFRKVVLARKVDLNLGACVNGLDILMRIKFGGHIGHIFYLNPGMDETDRFIHFDDGGEEMHSGLIHSREFLGCTPERLFRIKGSDKERVLVSEALAGTRTRGQSPSADAKLLHDLLSSKKDMLENEITGKFINDVLQKLEDNGWLEKNDVSSTSYDINGCGHDGTCNPKTSGREKFFVRRLRHLQHICQTFERYLSKNANVIDISRSLLSTLHPTPAVCGERPIAALEFIRKYETLESFDRGYYSGPFGYIGRDSADIVVSIRSALITNYQKASNLQLLHHPDSNAFKLGVDCLPESKVSVFGGAGIVDGSTVQGEWTETSHKLSVLSSLFPSSPMTLQSYSTPNSAWSSSLIEELVRCGVTTFYVCPGSRNTPLTVAIFKAMRSNVGIVRAISVHDERGAGFRALGYARKHGLPAAVVTSSGTAVANLYPSVIESSLDGVPLLLITADRPYESRDNGSNQSIDQVKIFSSSYIRWFRDIPPPSDDVPVSLALSDASHAVALTKQLMGPVHINIQYRENLAPDDGPIRNDKRIGSITKFQNARFTDVPGFLRWCQTGNRWLDTYYSPSITDNSYVDISELILKSRRGIIVVGNLRNSVVGGNSGEDMLSSTISHFAKVIGFPILASVQSGALRQEYPVLPYAEHILKHPLVSSGIKPDLILQLGCPLVSTEVSEMIVHSMKQNPFTKHVLVQQFYPHERADPHYTVTHRVSSSVYTFILNVIKHIESIEPIADNFGSELAPLLYLGRELEKMMPTILHEAAFNVRSDLFDLPASDPMNDRNEPDDYNSSLTEPQIMLAITEVLAEPIAENHPMTLFLSNSMPVRDGEFFLYPVINHTRARNSAFDYQNRFPVSVLVNRGASGIDGIISTAIGCSDLSNPTTLVCGDVTALHDLNGLYGLTTDESTSSNKIQSAMSNRIPLTTIIVNNGGGAIFSFLPISKHGQDVGFEKFWGTPTKNFSFRKGASAFGLSYRCVSSHESFKDAYRKSIVSGVPTIIEAKVVDRSTNVAVHQHITRCALDVVDKLLTTFATNNEAVKLPIKHYHFDKLQSSTNHSKKKSKTLLFLHGWMGDKTEWDSVAESLSLDFSDEWNILSIDLPGHGDAPRIVSSHQQILHKSLGVDFTKQESLLTLDAMAQTICDSLIRDHHVTSIDIIVGYSLGGRIALAMKQLCSSGFQTQKKTFLDKRGDDASNSILITDQTRIILLGSYIGKLPLDDHHFETNDNVRVTRDVSLTNCLRLSSYRSYLIPETEDAHYLTQFLTKWYSSKSLWGDLMSSGAQAKEEILGKRLVTLRSRRQDIASVLFGCSPPLTTQDYWKFIDPKKTFFIAGGLDKKYSQFGRRLKELNVVSKYFEVPTASHALIVEAATEVALIISRIINHDLYLIDESVLTDVQGMTMVCGTQQQNVDIERTYRLTSPFSRTIGSMKYKSFSISVVSSERSDKGVFGVGWGDNAWKGRELKRREGFLVSITSSDGMAVGVGEVSPLPGLHIETLEEAEKQLQAIEKFLSINNFYDSLNPEGILSLDGSLTSMVETIMISSGIKREVISPSVRSGLEMCLLSIASQLYGAPIHRALADNCFYKDNMMSGLSTSYSLLPINGLITKGANGLSERLSSTIFKSLKVKIGDKDPKLDASKLIDLKRSLRNGHNVMLRADANRAWNVQSAQTFFRELLVIDRSIHNIIEFIEEPLEKQFTNDQWSLEAQVSALEEIFQNERLKYALDESLADVAQMHDYQFDKIADDLRASFGQPNKIRNACAAFILKPTLLGLELSMQIAKIAQQEFQIDVVFSSTFDSGIGLSYISILAAVSDKLPFGFKSKYAHGLGTYRMLAGDTLSPAFESYVNGDGMLNVASISTALYGLSLDEISDFVHSFVEVTAEKDPSIAESYMATAFSNTGRDLTVSVSLLLPFSDEIASSRFTDLPQMSRWSPWLNSVTYLETAGLTEWNLNIKGVKFSWKAKSEVLNNPRGIKWESISGLKNSGVVEFDPLNLNSCIMKLKIVLIMPYILVSLFQGVPSAVQEFLQNKLLKWSLEMFRDAVKADLALERGDSELGDALIGAVEGRANALEEALK